MKKNEADLFQQYVELGENRTLKKLSEQTGVNLSKLKRLSAKYRWNDQIEEVNTVAEIATVTAVKTDVIAKQVVDAVEFRKMISLAVADAHQKMMNGEIEVKTVNDWHKVMSLYLEMVRTLAEHESNMAMVKEFSNMANAFDLIAEARNNN